MSATKTMSETITTTIRSEEQIPIPPKEQVQPHTQAMEDSVSQQITVGSIVAIGIIVLAGLLRIYGVDNRPLGLNEAETLLPIIQYLEDQSRVLLPHLADLRYRLRRLRFRVPLQQARHLRSLPGARSH